jgi:DNA repair exonuclease SbcCD nuclease subunit
MSKVVIITDTHFGSRNDSQLFMDYFDKFYKEVFFPYIDENKIKTVFHLGDLVDRRKYISFATLRRMKESFLEPLAERGINLHLLVGNHDATYKNTNDVNAPDQLLYGYSNVMVYDQPKEIMGGQLALMPWIPNEDVGEALSFIEGCKAKILFGHLEINTFDVMRGVKMEHGMDPKPLRKFDAVLSGHFHTKQDNGHIYYLGCPYEITFSDLADNKGFHEFDFETRELKFIHNPHKMFHRIYYDDKDKKFDQVVGKTDFSFVENCYVKVVVVNRTNQYFFEKFLDKIYLSNPCDLKVVDDFSLTTNEDDLNTEEIMSMAEDTATILNNYIDSLEIDADKEKLKTVRRSLYTEAQHVEF